MTGVPGVMQVPILKYFFGQSDDMIAQTDIVMLLTPRIIRTHEFNQRDLNPIYVGTNQNFGLTGPPPLIAAAAGRGGSRARDRARTAGTAGSAGRTEPERAADGRGGAVHDTPCDDTTAGVAAASAAEPDGAGGPDANDGRGHDDARTNGRSVDYAADGRNSSGRGTVSRADLRQQRLARHHRHADGDL